jgi:hypothetical protein
LYANKGFGTDRFNGVGFTAELDGFPSAAFGGEEFDLFHFEIALLKNLPHQIAYRTSCTDYRHAG